MSGMMNTSTGNGFGGQNNMSSYGMMAMAGSGLHGNISMA